MHSKLTNQCFLDHVCFCPTVVNGCPFSVICSQFDVICSYSSQLYCDVLGDTLSLLYVLLTPVFRLFANSLHPSLECLAVHYRQIGELYVFRHQQRMHIRSCSTLDSSNMEVSKRNMKKRLMLSRTLVGSAIPIVQRNSVPIVQVSTMYSSDTQNQLCLVNTNADQ